MRKAELISDISRKTGIIQVDVDQILTTALALIRIRVAEGREVRLQGFGAFKTKLRPQKIARNLKGLKDKNPEPLVLEPCLVAQFKPSRKFLILT